MHGAVLQISRTFVFTTLVEPLGPTLKVPVVLCPWPSTESSHSKVAHATQNARLFALKLQQYGPFIGE